MILGPARRLAEPVSFRAPRAGSVPAVLGAALVLMAAGTFLLLAAISGNHVAIGDGLLPLYGLSLLPIGWLTWWESTRPRTGVLPAWTSPPALIAGWTLAWIYVPSLMAFLDGDLLDDAVARQGGEAVLLGGLQLTGVALVVLSLAYHAMAATLRASFRPREVAERCVALPRVLMLYAVSAAARAFHLVLLGVAYGTDITAWGPLQPVAQWIGYVEDLRFLALPLLVADVIGRRTGYLWLAVAMLVELVLGVASGFLMPVILAVVACGAAAAALDRIRRHHLVLVAASGLAVATFVPVIAAVRQDRTGTVGTDDIASASDAVTAPFAYWLGGVSSGDGAYAKFFGRQAEVAAATGLVTTLTPAVIPYEGLDRFLTLPAALIPRVLWPDKPMLSRGVWFSANFRGLGQNTTSYSAMTIFSEGYLFYGWIGAALAMVIAGVVLAVLRHRLDNPGLAPVYLALLPTILHVEPEFSSYLNTLIQRSVVFVVVFILLSRGGAARPDAARMRP